jgi:hypothetical protein
MNRWFCACIAAMCFAGCFRSERATYAIRDFDPALQPYLVAAVSSGIVGYDSASLFIREHATTEELSRLAHSEHPLLRALALWALVERPSVDHFSVIMGHLSDTAMVLEDRGEFGADEIRVSDFLLLRAKWHSLAARDSTEAEVLLHHNYLRGAYTALQDTTLFRRFYPEIRVMALRDRFIDEGEYALYALAASRRPVDIPLIDSIFLANGRVLGRTSFHLMKDHPDTSYVRLMQKFGFRWFSRIVRRDWPHTAQDNDLIDAVASYQNDSTAKLLRLFFDKLSSIRSEVDTGSVRGHLVEAIRRNACPAYSNLIRETEPYYKWYRSGILEVDIPLDSTRLKDTSAEPVWWLQ